VADRLREIAGNDASRAERVFMKIGASGTVSANLLTCFAGASPYQVEMADALMPEVEFFRQGEAAGTTPFQRKTKAAKVGVSAIWAISGTPSPMESEILDINPRFAFVNYGTNDMGYIPLPGSLDYFYENMSRLLDQLEEEGVVDIISGVNPRSDSLTYARWVSTFDAATLAIAEERQLPYLSLLRASLPLAKLGLLSDGLHGNYYVQDGKAQPCIFTPEGLGFNYNVRNLESMRLLAAAKRVVVDGEDGDQGGGLPAIAGDGSHAQPFVIDRLPFVHAGDTRGGESRFAGYPECDSGQNESGPERVYRLELDEPTPLRVVVLDRGAVDVDAHLLLGPEAEDCVERHDRVVAYPVPAGESTIVVDSFVSAGGTSKQGRYLLLVVPCDAGDPGCQ
jgi:hypothetical protein